MGGILPSSSPSQGHWGLASPQLPQPCVDLVSVPWGLESGFIRVLENLESPGILWHFPGLESPGKMALVLESSGNLLDSTKKYQMYGRQ